MEQNTNQNEIPSEENLKKEVDNNNTSKTNSTPKSVSQNERPNLDINKNKKIPKEALHKALMRTLRGDISKSLGPNATQQQVDHFVPVAEKKQLDSKVDKNSEPKDKNNAVVHTFKDDVQDLVRNKKMSFSRIAALESDRDERIPQNEEKRDPWKTTMIISLAILFLVIGGVITFGTFYAYKLNTSPNLTPLLDPSIIFTEAREKIDITNTNKGGVMTLLADSKRNVLSPAGSVIEFYITKFNYSRNGQKTTYHLNSTDFLKTINASVPNTFIQALGPKYVVGVYVTDRNVPFLILTTKSYGYAFSGMLAWEKNIEENLMPFFSPSTDFTRPVSTQGNNTFADTVIENLDARILRDKNGNIRILYSFINRNTIVITTDVRAVVELAKRLRVQKK